MTAAKTKFLPCCTQAYHDALVADPVRWMALRSIGRQEDELDDGTVQFLRLANCPLCDSTLAAVEAAS